MKNLEGKLTISRPHGKDEIVIRLEDALSAAQFLEVRVSMFDMMDALTGHGFRPCEFDYYPHAPIGMKREHKRELVQRPPPHARDDKEAARATFLSPYEVDGWAGRVGDLFNSHNWRKGPDGEDLVEVTFIRHVAPTEAPQ